MTIFTGTVTAIGEIAEGRTVRVIRRDTGVVLDETITDSVGFYSLDSGAVLQANVIIVALPTESPGATNSYNAEILDQF